jgi:hypothetical protein
MGGINMIQEHANLDVLDNCDLHPVQCVCVFFPDRHFCFFRKKSSENSTNFANVFGNIWQIFDITKLKKRKNPSYPAVKCKSQGVLMQFWIFTFL